jgi:hypothetical protein
MMSFRANIEIEAQRLHRVGLPVEFPQQIQASFGQTASSLSMNISKSKTER